MSKPWFLYLIECRGGRIYTGVTVDVAARYAAHAAGKGARYTRAYPPERVLLVLEYPGRSEALRAEYAVKQWSAEKKRAWLQEMAGAGRSDGCKGPAVMPVRHGPRA